MTSQILAIFYLNDLDHFIKEKLKISYYVRYQDDFLLFHPSKKYLKYCLEQIKKEWHCQKLRPFWHLLEKISTNHIVLIKNSSKLNSLSNSKILLTNPIIYFYFIVIAYITIAKGYGLFLSKTSLVLPYIKGNHIVRVELANPLIFLGGRKFQGLTGPIFPF